MLAFTLHKMLDGQRTLLLLILVIITNESQHKKREKFKSGELL